VKNAPLTDEELFEGCTPEQIAWMTG